MQSVFFFSMNGSRFRQMLSLSFSTNRLAVSYRVQRLYCWRFALKHFSHKFALLYDVCACRKLEAQNRTRMSDFEYLSGKMRELKAGKPSGSQEGCPCRQDCCRPGSPQCRCTRGSPSCRRAQHGKSLTRHPEDR